MTTEYGLTSLGFVPKTLDVIRSDLNTALKNAFGASIDLSDESAFGQVVGILAERESLIWELLEAVVASQDPDQAVGAALDALCLLTGTFRPAATHSTVPVVLLGTPSTTVLADSLVATSSSSGSVQFSIESDATLTAVSSWAGTTAYAVGDRVHLAVSGTDGMFQCITAGTSASSGGPTGTGLDITDGTVHWTWVADDVPGNGAADAIAVAVATGPVAAAAHDLTLIVTAIVGWSGLVNLTDATLGRDLATDAELRNLRETELSNAGNCTVDAILSHLTEVQDVTSVTVFENPTDLTDADGMPPHSVEALVRGGLDQDIVDALFASVAAGIATTGTTSGTATDSQGTAHTIKFSRPDEIEIYVAITLTKDAKLYPADGDDQVAAAIVAFGDAQATGKDAVSSSILAQAFKVAGVLDVTSCFIGTAPSPSSSVTIAISLRQLATYDALRITVASSSATP